MYIFCHPGCYTEITEYLCVLVCELGRLDCWSELKGVHERMKNML